MGLLTASEMKLIEVLRSKRTGLDDLYAPEAFHGFFVGLAISPVMIPPGAWITMLFDETKIEFENEDEVNQVMGGILSLYNRINAEVNHPSFRYPFDYRKADKEMVRKIDYWVYGLSEALKLGIGEMFFASDEFDYEKANDEEKNIYSSFGVIYTSAYQDDITPILDDIPPEQRQNITKAHILAGLYSVIPVAVTKIYEYAKKHAPDIVNKHARAEYLHRKVGRNEPCPILNAITET
jgi:yecA family protein